MNSSSFKAQIPQSQTIRIVCDLCFKEMLKKNLKQHLYKKHKGESSIHFEINQSQLNPNEDVYLPWLSKPLEVKNNEQQVVQNKELSINEVQNNNNFANENIGTNEVTIPIELTSQKTKNYTLKPYSTKDLFSYPEPSINGKNISLMFQDHWNISATIAPLINLTIPKISRMVKEITRVEVSTENGEEERDIILLMNLQGDQLYQLKQLLINHATIYLTIQRFTEQAKVTMHDKIKALFLKIRRTIFVDYYQQSLNQYLKLVFNALLNEQNQDSVELVERRIKGKDYEMKYELFRFFGIQKFSFLKFNTIFTWQPSVIRTQQSRGNQSRLPSQKHIYNSSKHYDQALYVSIALQRFTTYFNCMIYRESLKVHDCLMLYLQKWLKSLTEIKKGRSSNKGDEIMKIVKYYEERIWFLLEPKTQVFKGTEQYLDENISLYPGLYDSQQVTNYSSDFLKSYNKLKDKLNLPTLQQTQRCFSNVSYLIRKGGKEELLHACECKLHS